MRLGLSMAVLAAAAATAHATDDIEYVLENSCDWADPPPPPRKVKYREQHVYPPNPNVSRQVRRARARAERKLNNAK